jgi:hypothetical protein
MKLSIVVIDELPVSVSQILNRLAASGRVGLVDFGKKLSGDSALSELTGADDRSALCSSAVAAGLSPSAGDVILSCRAVCLGKDGNVDGFLTGSDQLEVLVNAVDGAQIDGVNFQAREHNGSMLILMSGEAASHFIAPNKCSPGTALPQVGATKKQAKKTASALNKLIYRTAKKGGISFAVEGSGLFSDADASSAKPAYELATFRAKSIAEAEKVLASLDERSTTIIVFAGGALAPAIIHGGGILPGPAKAFSPAACRRGFCVEASSLLDWVSRAAGSGTFK